MKSKQQLLQDLKASLGDSDSFVENANLNGGMHLEARVKLLENQIRDAYFFIANLIEQLPEPDDGR